MRDGIGDGGSRTDCVIFSSSLHNILFCIIRVSHYTIHYFFIYYITDHFIFSTSSFRLLIGFFIIFNIFSLLNNCFHYNIMVSRLFTITSVNITLHFLHQFLISSLYLFYFFTFLSYLIIIILSSQYRSSSWRLYGAASMIRHYMLRYEERRDTFIVTRMLLHVSGAAYAAPQAIMPGSMSGW